MNQITGKVLNHANLSGIGNLLVVAYDIDLIPNPGQSAGDNAAPTPQSRLLEALQLLLADDTAHPQLQLASQLIYRLFTASDDAEDPIWSFTGPAGGRLGSGVTSEDGAFSIRFEDQAFQQGSQESRPDLLLMVLAPDQPLGVTLGDDTGPGFIGTPEFQRLLHIGFLPLRNMAREEAAVIRIAPDLLRRFGLDRATLPQPDAARVRGLLAGQNQQRAELEGALRTDIQRQVERADHRDTGARRFVRNLSSLTKGARRSPLFLPRGETSSDRLRNPLSRAGREGIEQISQSTRASSARRPQAVLGLGTDDLDRLLTDGDAGTALEQVAAGGSVQVELRADALCDLMYSRNRGTEARRREDGPGLRRLRDEVTARLDALRRPPDDAGSEPPTDTEDDAPAEPDVASAEERIKAIVMQRIAQATAGSVGADQVNGYERTQKRRISASLAEMTPPVGAADTTAFHDFTSLQIAYPDVWTEAFDGDVEAIVRQLRIEYEDAYESYREGSGDVLDRLRRFDDEELHDLKEYTELLGQLSGDIAAVEQTPMPRSVQTLLALELEDTPTTAPRNANDAFGGAALRLKASLLLAGRASSGPGLIDLSAADPQQQLWNELSIGQQAELIELAEEFAALPRSTIRPAELSDKFGAKAFLRDQFDNRNPDAQKLDSLTRLLDQVDTAPTSEDLGEAAALSLELRARAHAIIAAPRGRGTRAQRLMAELAERLKAPHSFRVFAENSYNFGILTTHRQQWEPGDYQAGDLVSTITLAPGEKRQYVKKVTLKRSRNRKEIDKNSSTISDERAYTSKVTADIIEKVSTNTNFSHRVAGSASGQLGVFSINAESETRFGRDQAAETERRKQSIREATRKAAQEYRSERSLELVSEVTGELDASTTSEINNPNNEITVTYLFYELERQFRVSEHLHKVTPVILVAQRIPAPHEIDEDFILANEWILRRVILDGSFLEPLDYVAEGLIGDEVSLEVLRERYDTQQSLVEDLGESVGALVDMQQTLRDSLIQTAEREKLARVARRRERRGRRRRIARRLFSPDKLSERIAGGAASLTFGESDNPAELEARREAIETRLEFLDTNLEAERQRLEKANSALAESASELTTALQDLFTRRNLVTQLKLHIKDNILYYMQAIWTHEYSHQRHMRLYNLPIDVPMPGRRPPRNASPTAPVTLNPLPRHVTDGIYRLLPGFNDRPPPLGVTLDWPTNTAGQVVYHTVGKRLHEIADVDNLLGFKGNHMIFPLRTCTYITDYMMQDYVDEYLGARAPDFLDDIPVDELLTLAERVWHAPDTEDDQRDALERLILERVNSPRLADERVIVPTGQLFIEALTGTHPLLEPFKLQHRALDLHKAREEVRAEELENLRRAMRLVREEGPLLDDPQQDKHVRVSGDADAGIDIDG